MTKMTTTKMTMRARDGLTGMIFGAAIGDAMARDAEFMRMKQIYALYGDQGIIRLRAPALFTDDTQMLIAVAHALSDVRDHTPERLARALERRFINWMLFDPPRAPGQTCLTAIKKLRAGDEWVNATVVNSYGCGANMRVAPVVAIPNYSVMCGAARLQAAITHGHPRAIVSAELTAIAVRFALDGISLDRLPRLLTRVAMARKRQCAIGGDTWLGDLPSLWEMTDVGTEKQAWQNSIDGLLNLSRVLKRPKPVRNVCTVLGESWVADEALLTSLYYAIQYRNEPMLAISEATRTSGDSDSIACITGAIVGAAAGRNAWPRSWRERVERSDELDAVAKSLTEIATR